MLLGESLDALPSFVLFWPFLVRGGSFVPSILQSNECMF